MQRLVIALTSLLVLAGGAVVAGYLFVFAASPDRTARAVPEGATLYATVYLQPSAGQRMNLGELLGRVPGFADEAALEGKIHEITQRLLGEAGIDYEANVRPWLGNQVAVAVRPGAGLDPAEADVFVLMGVRDPPAVREALERELSAAGAELTSQTYQGVGIRAGSDTAYAVTDDLLVLARDVAGVQDALDADANRAPSLADSADFAAALRALPADHVGAAYLDLEGLSAAASDGLPLDGYSSLALVLVIEPDGLRLVGRAPFDADRASEGARHAFALSSEPSSLAEWMPADTQAEVVVFGLSSTIAAIEDQLGATPGLEDAAAALAQLRALAALGLGIDVDGDLLPLLDREAGLAVTGLEDGAPHGQLLLRPADPDTAAGALGRMRDALAERGADIDEREEGGVTITTLALAEVGSVSYAVSHGIVVLALDADGVVAALEANADGASLADNPAYRAAWQLAGDRGGNEAYLDIGSVVDQVDTLVELTEDGRDILRATGALGMTAPARDTTTEIHLVITAR